MINQHIVKSWMYITGVFFFATLLLAQSPGSGCHNNKGNIFRLPFEPSERTIYYQLGETTVPIRIIQYGEREDIVCMNLHDNETTSVEAARIVLQNTEGLIIKIENNEQRLIRFRYHGRNYSFDPNRMFSATGIKESLEENGSFDPSALTEIEKFAARILQQVPSSNDWIIALHNNTNHGFSARSYLPGNENENDAAEVKIYEGQDPDDFIFTTDRSFYNKASKLGYNCILQDNENAEKDGSLSVWSGENDRGYINIETEHGKKGMYIEILEKVIGVLEELK